VPSDDPDARMGWYVIVGSIPIVVLGLLFQDQIEHALRNLWITAAVLAGFALILGLADRIGAKTKTLTELTWRDGIMFGLAQALALIPGVSRSGGTITAGLLLGYTREAAARYSFLLAIPAVLGSGFYQLVKSGFSGGEAGLPATLIATLVAFAVGYVVIIAFLKIVSTYSYKGFVWYRLGLAALVVVLLLTHVLQAMPPA
jgi:undecaprenyl-diphosphatase